MTSDEIAKVKDAIAAFNAAKTWDEFLVNLDLIGIDIDELESKYCDMMSMIDDIILKKIFDNLKGNDRTISLKKTFSRCTTEFDESSAHVRIALPVSIEYNNSGLSHVMKVYCSNDRFVGIHVDLCDDMEAFRRVDMAAEMANGLMLRLAVENSRR